MNRLREGDFDLVRRIVAAQRTGRLRLDELASALDMSPSHLSRTLGRLVDAGWIERVQESTDTGRAVYYHPKPAMQVRWSSPAEGVALEWTAQGEVDWEFPLVSRVPDLEGRAAILAFLRELREAKILDATRYHATSPKGRKDKREFLFPGLTVTSFGSVARGQARPGSDVDLVAVQDADEHGEVPDVEEKVLDVAAQVTLGAARPLQVHVTSLEGLDRLPTRIKAALRTEGIIVHDGLRKRPRGASMGLWEVLDGQR